MTASLTPPNVILLDWHGTLVDTHDAMFSAMEDMLPQLEELDLVSSLLGEDECNSAEDAKLVRYIRLFRRLHPRILAERRVSRTDIFNAIFGDNRDAKAKAHQCYNACYRKYFGQVKPLQDGIYQYLTSLKTLGIRLGVATNRNREFLEKELSIVDGGRWVGLFDVTICAGDVTEYKPDPEILLLSLAELAEAPGGASWYIGDSYVDMVTGRNAGVTRVFFNGGQVEDEWLNRTFAAYPDATPDAVINDFEGLMNLLERIQRKMPSAFHLPVAEVRPPAFAGPQAPPERVEPDWHPAVAELTPPTLILFDWHATLVDTLDAMYHAVDDMLPEFQQLGLMDKLIPPEHSRSPEDARLVEYVRAYAQLHPKVKADRKISRTDIFEVLFGDNQQAKQQAHKVFNHHYRKHYGNVAPFEPRVKELLVALRGLGLKTGVITNRDREFFEHELAAVDGVGWTDLFDTQVCGDDTPQRKPHPDQLFQAASELKAAPGPDVWYVGDSTTDVIAAKRAGMTAVFFNGALWDLPWLHRIFPGTERHPFQPDVVVNDFSEFWALVLTCLHLRK
ncbi:HAD family hydrolase [Hydrocarboniclastica marina]|uniref:HAD family hydrolase n=1 Tax=Hydrocarboniclastica marina TaxID=2259620 RepID=A0A4P7XFY2_9ALTE|nr:HAD family hydrolase [Hydrocarboniclastica marina]QCF24657.1 HAD family hydrolase [Hydrocarboniclastica marina]